MSISRRSRRWQPVQPCGEQRRDRRRDRHVGKVAGRDPPSVLQHETTLIDEEPGDLLRVERVPFGSLGDPRADRLIHGVVGEEVRDERSALLGAERFEQDRRRVQLSAGPSWVIVQELGTGHAREQDRGITREVGHVLDELQELRLGPLEVIDHEDQRPFRRELLEQHPDRPERLLRRGLAAGDPDRLPDPLRDRVGVLIFDPSSAASFARAASGVSASFRSATSISASASG